MFFLEIFLDLTQVASKVQSYLFLEDSTELSAFVTHVTLPFLSIRCLKYQPFLPRNLCPPRASGIVFSVFPPTPPRTVFQTFQIVFAKYLSVVHLQPLQLAKPPGQIWERRGLCLPTPAALGAHRCSGSRSSGRIQGTTPSAPNARGVLPVTHHSIPDTLYRTYIPETAHTVCSPCSHPTGSGCISQCWALNKCALIYPTSSTATFSQRVYFLCLRNEKK